MLSELKKGDDVVTQGGIIGKITGIKDNEMTLQLQEGVRVRVLRSAVTGLYTGRRRRPAKAETESPRRRPLKPLSTDNDTHGKRLVVEGSTLRCRHRGGGALPGADAGPGGEAAERSSRSTSRRGFSSGWTFRAVCTSSTRSTSTRRSRTRSTACRRTSRIACAATRASPTSTSAARVATTSSSRSRTRPTRRSSTTSCCASTASRWTWSSATPATGVVRLRLDPDQVEEVRDYALRQGIETIRDRVDKLGVAEPTIIKKGTDIIVELPGLKPADFERIKNIIGRTAQLEFKIVDDGPEYMKKVAARCPSATRRRRCADRHRRRHRGLERGGLGQAARGRLPALEEPRRAPEVLRRADRRPRRSGRSRDRLRGDAGARRERRADARQASGGPTTCTSARR